VFPGAASSPHEAAPGLSPNKDKSCHNRTSAIRTSAAMMLKRVLRRDDAETDSSMRRVLPEAKWDCNDSIFSFQATITQALLELRRKQVLLRTIRLGAQSELP
jgi:hypothetical protein